MKKFEMLVPTDLSEVGNKAFETAEKIRKVLNGQITPMHTFKEIIWPDGISMPNLDEVLSESVKNQVAQKLRNLAQESTEEQFVQPPVITYGDPFNRILEESKNYDMVVLSTHGRKGFKKALLGSVAEKMIRNATVPVVVSKQTMDSDDIQNLIITTDMSEASYKAFPMAVEILKTSKAKATLLHIVSLEHTGTMEEGRKLAYKAELKLSKILDEHFSTVKEQISPEVEVSTSSPHIAMGKIISRRSYDLLILSTLGKTALSYMMIGSNAASLIRTVPCPVMVINPGK